jgi:hypothetical protein
MGVCLSILCKPQTKKVHIYGMELNLSPNKHSKFLKNKVSP